MSDFSLLLSADDARRPAAVWTLVESVFNAESTYDSKIVPICCSMLENLPISFDSFSIEHRSRHCCLILISSVSIEDVPFSLHDRLIDLCLRVIELDNDQNAIIALRIFYELLKVVRGFQDSVSFRIVSIVSNAFSVFHSTIANLAIRGAFDLPDQFRSSDVDFYPCIFHVPGDPVPRDYSTCNHFHSLRQNIAVSLFPAQLSHRFIADFHLFTSALLHPRMQSANISSLLFRNTISALSARPVVQIDPHQACRLSPKPPICKAVLDDPCNVLEIILNLNDEAKIFNFKQVSEFRALFHCLCKSFCLVCNIFRSCNELQPWLESIVDVFCKFFTLFPKNAIMCRRELVFVFKALIIAQKSPTVNPIIFRLEFELLPTLDSLFFRDFCLQSFFSLLMEVVSNYRDKLSPSTFFPIIEFYGSSLFDPYLASDRLIFALCMLCRLTDAARTACPDTVRYLLVRSIQLVTAKLESLISQLPYFRNPKLRASPVYGDCFPFLIDVDGVKVHPCSIQSRILVTCQTGLVNLSCASLFLHNNDLDAIKSELRGILRYAGISIRMLLGAFRTVPVNGFASARDSEIDIFPSRPVDASEFPVQYPPHAVPGNIGEQKILSTIIRSFFITYEFYWMEDTKAKHLRDQKELFDNFLYIITSVEAPIFLSVFEAEFELFITTLKFDPSLLQLLQLLISNEKFSFKLCRILLDHIFVQMPNIDGNLDDPCTNIYLRLYRMTMTCIASNPTTGCPLLAPFFTKFIEICSLKNGAGSTSRAHLVFLLVLFRNTSVAGFEPLYDEFIPKLGDFLQNLNAIMHTDTSTVSKNLIAELCLSLPTRMAHMIPFIRFILPPLLYALQGSPDLVNQALRVLDVFVDCVSTSYLVQNFKKESQLLISHLGDKIKCPVSNQPKSTQTHMVLKIIGKLSVCCRGNLFNLHNQLDSSLKTRLVGKIFGAEIDFPIEKLISHALNILETAQKDDYSVSVAFNLFNNLDIISSDVYYGLLLASAVAAGSENTSKLVSLMSSNRPEMVDAFVRAICHSNPVRLVARNLLKTFLETDQDPESFFSSVLLRICTKCYGNDSSSQFGGLFALSTIIHLTPPVQYLVKHQTDICRALLFVLKSLHVIPKFISQFTQDALFFLLKSLHRFQDSVQTMKITLIQLLASDLASACLIVRETVQAALQVLADLASSDVSDLLAPLKDRLLVPIFAKPLRTRPVLFQIGAIDAISYCLLLRPPLVDINDEQLIRLFTETLAIAESDTDQRELRIACVQLLNAAFSCPDLNSAKFLRMRSRTVSVFLKFVNIAPPEAFQACFNTLSQLPHKSYKDNLQNFWRQFLNSIQDINLLTPNNITGHVLLLEFFYSSCKVELSRKLFEHLNAWAAQIIQLDAAGKLVAAADCTIMVVKLIKIFPISAASPSPDAGVSLHDLVCFVMDLDNRLIHKVNDLFFEPLLQSMCRNPEVSVGYLVSQFTPQLLIRLLGMNAATGLFSSILDQFDTLAARSSESIHVVLLAIYKRFKPSSDIAERHFAHLPMLSSPQYNLEHSQTLLDLYLEFFPYNSLQSTIMTRLIDWFIDYPLNYLYEYTRTRLTELIVHLSPLFALEEAARLVKLEDYVRATLCLRLYAIPCLSVHYYMQDLTFFKECRDTFLYLVYSIKSSTDLKFILEVLQLTAFIVQNLSNYLDANIIDVLNIAADSYDHAISISACTILGMQRSILPENVASSCFIKFIKCVHQELRPAVIQGLTYFMPFPSEWMTIVRSIFTDHQMQNIYHLIHVISCFTNELKPLSGTLLPLMVIGLTKGIIGQSSDWRIACYKTLCVAVEWNQYLVKSTLDPFCTCLERLAVSYESMTFNTRFHAVKGHVLDLFKRFLEIYPDAYIRGDSFARMAIPATEEAKLFVTKYLEFITAAFTRPVQDTMLYEAAWIQLIPWLKTESIYSMLQTVNQFLVVSTRYPKLYPIIIEPLVHCCECLLTDTKPIIFEINMPITNGILSCFPFLAAMPINIKYSIAFTLLKTCLQVVKPSVELINSIFNALVQVYKSDDAPKAISILVAHASSLDSEVQSKFLALLVQIANETESRPVLKYLLDLASSFLSLPQNLFPTVNQRASLLSKFVLLENKNMPDLLAEYLEIVRQQAENRTVYNQKLQLAFHLGLNSSNHEIQHLFSEIYRSSVPMNSLQELLEFLFSTNEWTVAGSRYYLHTILDCITSAIDFDNLNLKNAIMAMQFYSPTACHDVFVALFPKLWTLSGATMSWKIVEFLANDSNHNQESMQPNVVSSMLEAATKCRPIPLMPPHVVKYLASTFNAWHVGIEYLDLLLESELSIESAAQVTESTLDALGFMLCELKERDLYYGLCRWRCKYPETNAALSYAQSGYWQEAQVLLESAQEKGRTGTFSFNENEYLVLEEEWIETCKHLQQWDTIAEIARKEQNHDLLIECLWRTADWPYVQAPRIDATEPISVSSVDNLIDLLSDGPRGRLLKAVYALHQLTLVNKDDSVFNEFTRAANEARDILVFEWHRKPCTVGPWNADLYFWFQQLTELHEAAQVYKILEGTNISNIDERAMEIHPILALWRDRIPSTWEDLVLWSDMLAWRHAIFSSINRMFFPLLCTNGVASSSVYRGFHEIAHVFNLYARALRHHGLIAQCNEFLPKIFLLPNIEVIDAFNKFKQHTKCYLARPEYFKNDPQVTTLGSLSVLKSMQKVEYLLLRARVMALENRESEANRYFAQALSSEVEAAKFWAHWGEYQEQLFSQRKDTDDHGFHAVNCYLHALSVSSNVAGRRYAARILWLLRHDDAQLRNHQGFEAGIHADSTGWHWIAFIPQLMEMLDMPDQATYARLILAKVAKNHPQALFYQVRSKRNVEMENMLKACAPLLVLSMERIASQLTTRLKPQPRDKLYSLLFTDFEIDQVPLEAVDRLKYIQQLNKRERYIATRQYICELEREIDQTPDSCILANYLMEFEYQRLEDVHVPGQCMDSLNYLKIQRFKPEIKQIRHQGQVAKGIEILANDGQVYAFIVQNDSSNDKLGQISYFLNPYLERHSESKRRGLQFHVPCIVPLSIDMRLLKWDYSWISIEEIWNQLNVPFEDEFEYINNPSIENFNKLEYRNIICKHLSSSLPSYTSLFLSRRQLMFNYAVSSFCAFVFCNLNELTPMRVLISLERALVWMNLQVSNMESSVCFRITRSIQDLYGVYGLEGPFLSSIVATCRAILFDERRIKYIESFINVFAYESSVENTVKQTNKRISRIKQLLQANISPSVCVDCEISTKIKQATDPRVLNSMNPQWKSYI